MFVSTVGEEPIMFHRARQVGFILTHIDGAPLQDASHNIILTQAQKTQNHATENYILLCLPLQMAALKSCPKPHGSCTCTSTMP